MTGQDYHKRHSLLWSVDLAWKYLSLFFLTPFFPYCLNFLSNPSIINLLQNFNRYLNFEKEKENPFGMPF